jgi:hypothetical protein
MDRVELVFSIIRADMPDVVRQIEAGDIVDVSMGTKVAFDVCSICKHQSKKFSEYCSHLKYEMNRIYPDGRKVYALNPDPNFFDISIVDVGADRTAKILAKVASANRVVHSAALGEKSAINKENAMDKGVASDMAVVKALPEKLKLYWESLGKHIDDGSCDIDTGNFGGFGNINDILSALTDKDIMLRPHEFSSMLLNRMGLGDIADDVFSSRSIFNLGGSDSGADEVPVNILNRQGELPLGMPNHYSVQRSMSPNSMTMKFRLVAGGKVAAAKSKNYVVKIAKSRLESTLAKSYISYVKQATKRIVKKAQMDMGAALPAFLLAILMGKAALEPNTEDSQQAKLFATINSLSNKINLGSADIMGVPMQSIMKDTGMTESEMKFQAEKQLSMLDKMKRGGFSNEQSMQELGPLKYARMTLAPVHALASCFNLVKLSSGKSDIDVAKEIYNISPTATALSLSFQKSFV